VHLGLYVVLRANDGQAINKQIFRTGRPLTARLECFSGAICQELQNNPQFPLCSFHWQANKIGTEAGLDFSSLTKGRRKPKNDRHNGT
jgi:hypothetical protein